MENLNTEEIINGLLQNDSTYVEDKECIRKAIILIKELTEENETLTIKCNAWHLAAERVGEEIQVIKANTVREIFTEIYSSLDYIEEQMDPDEIPECFFSVREDIDSLKEKFEGEVNADG